MGDTARDPLLNARREAVMACLRSAGCECAAPMWQWGDGLALCRCGVTTRDADVQMAAYAAMTPEERRAAADSQLDPHYLLGRLDPGPSVGDTAAVPEGAQTEMFDPDRCCPKCGHDDIGTLYRPNSHGYDCRDHRHRDFTIEDDCCKDEHFDRSCHRCQFSWREEVGGRV